MPSLRISKIVLAVVVATGLIAFVCAIGQLGRREPSVDAAPAAPPAPKVRVGILTGGHTFDTGPFLKMFEGHDGLVFQHLPQKNGGEAFDSIEHWPYDVIVLYNFKQSITPQQQANLLKLLDRGVGVVILHHAVAAYVDWPLYKDISGVEYHTKPWKLDGRPMPASTFKHNVSLRVHIADANHPITAGLKDFQLTDETYKGSTIRPDVHPLLTTEEPTSDRVIGFAKTYKNARVCYLQSGHGRTAYENPSYRTLVVRAIEWAAGKQGK